MDTQKTTKSILVAGLLLISNFSFLTSTTAGTNALPIKHTIVIMEENHSFDNYFGTYPGANGLGANIALPESSGSSNLVKPFHINGTTVSHDLCHGWECEHVAYHDGKMDGFVYASGSNLTMGYFDYHQIPYYWDYATRFVLLDNFYTSVMAPSMPNHLYLIAGQSGGLVRRVLNANFTFKTIVDELDQNHVSWKYYAGSHSQLNGWNPLPGFDSFKRNPSMIKNLAEPSQFYADLANNALADVTWIMPSSDQASEHPPYDISLGERNVVSLINAVMNSRYWDSTAIFLTWDESGGWYDHVPPPQVDQYGYGFRVPCLIISPFAKQGYVDHTQSDFTSILKFIETVYSLPALTDRDASANNLLEAFDFADGANTPLVLPGVYLPDVYPLTSRPNNTKMVVIGPTNLTSGSATKLPDLAIIALSITPLNPESGDNVSVTYTMKNLGSGDAVGFAVALYHNSTSSNYRRVDASANLSLKAGETITSSFSHPYRVRAGPHTLTVVADDLASFSESDSQDNAMLKTLFVPFPHGSGNSTTASAATSSDATTTVVYNIPAVVTIFTVLIVAGAGLLSFLLGMKAGKLSKATRG
ncbi:MAG: hypothetical protein LYZ69_05195 [Nitrososphaerales archaeon]|nr:hypothetical protein [Nitrososphaerales archaeon]